MSHSQEHQAYFQQLQTQFAAHIRNPENVAYAPEGEKPIEARRLKVYQELFYNNLHDFFSQLFPVCKEVLGGERWRALIREYMVKHNAETPLFHELGEEFLLFLQREYQPLTQDPDFLLELAHYEWVELALAVSEEVPFIKADAPVSLDDVYELSPLAWPLAYEWPVHQVSEAFQPDNKPQEVTTLLVYRAVDENGEDRVDFMTLTPVLYQWLTSFDKSLSAKAALQAVTQNLEVDENALESFALQTLQELQTLGVIRKVV